MKSAHDHELVRLIGSGKEQAFAELFARHGALVLGYARRFVARQEIAEEISQDVWVKVVKQAVHFKGEGVVPWLLAITRNASLDFLRSRDRSSLSFEQLSETREFEDLSRESVEALLVDAERMKELRSALEGLPDAQRAALMMWMTEEMSYEQIARELATSVASVKSLLFRARQTLAGRA